MVGSCAALLQTVILVLCAQRLSLGFCMMEQFLRKGLALKSCAHNHLRTGACWAFGLSGFRFSV